MSLHRLWFLALVGLLITLTLPILPPTPRPLTFEERVKAQEAIERVYYNHRIWPKENPQPKPPFEQVVLRAFIDAKVTRFIRKCSALESYWHRPVEPTRISVVLDGSAETDA